MENCYIKCKDAINQYKCHNQSDCLAIVICFRKLQLNFYFLVILEKQIVHYAMAPNKIKFMGKIFYFIKGI